MAKTVYTVIGYLIRKWNKGEPPVLLYVTNTPLFASKTFTKKKKDFKRHKRLTKIFFQTDKIFYLDPLASLFFIHYIQFKKPLGQLYVV